MITHIVVGTIMFYAASSVGHLRRGAERQEWITGLFDKWPHHRFLSLTAAIHTDSKKERDAQPHTRCLSIGFSNTSYTGKGWKRRVSLRLGLAGLSVQKGAGLFRIVRGLVLPYEYRLGIQEPTNSISR